MRKIAWKLLRFLKIASFIQISYKGILDEYGWFKSFNKKQSIDKDGNPIPWFTYSLISFISDRLTNELNVFEFGSGNSTLWFSHKVEKVISVEHNKEWYNIVKDKMPSNVKLIYQELEYDNEYCRTAKKFEEFFDIVIIDGRDRNNCVYNSVDKLTDKGIIIFDNTQLDIYSDSQNFLKSKGFKRLDFKGLCPAVAHTNTTTVFYKANNCLNI